MNSKQFLYFWIAALTTMTQRTAMPASFWDWFQFMAVATLSGLIALKALQSAPQGAGDQLPNPNPQDLTVTATATSAGS